MSRHKDQAKKSQSAMEYLMTYGWAILIIAAVTGALFQLGVFNGIGTPNAQAGSCQVSRPNGPGTTQFISLTGTCTGEQPEFVAQFNGASSYISVGSTTNFPSGPTNGTVVIWVYQNQISNKETAFDYGPSSSAYNSIAITFNWQTAGQVGLDDCGTALFTSGNVLKAGIWYQVAITWSVGNDIIYVNGVPETEGSKPSHPVLQGASASIGSRGTCGPAPYLNGSLANIQLYDTALSQPEIATLYQEGIGAAPIDPYHIVGWWPLNGNAQDYSGNNNNGQATDVKYLNSKASGYTQP